LHNLNSPKKYLPLYNILVAGSKSIGKTQLVNRLIGNDFSEAYKQTFSIDLHIKIKNQDMRFYFWDSPGEEKLRSILEPFYKVNAFIISYDLSNRSSFDAVDIYINNINIYLKKHNKKENPIIFLVATKGDLTSSQVVSDHEGRMKAQRLKCTDFIQTSAKNNDNIEPLFNILIQKCIKNYESKANKNESTRKQAFSSYTLIFLSLSSTLLIGFYLGPIFAILSFLIGLKYIIQARKYEENQRVETALKIKKEKENLEKKIDDVRKIPVYPFKRPVTPKPTINIIVPVKTKIEFHKERRKPGN
jgi:small GTP-binding protein